MSIDPVNRNWCLQAVLAERMEPASSMMAREMWGLLTNCRLDFVLERLAGDQRTQAYAPFESMTRRDIINPARNDGLFTRR